MRLTYTLVESARRSSGVRGRAVGRLLAVVTVLGVAIGCLSGRSPLPQGAPPLAPGSTPEPVRYEVMMPGRRAAVRVFVERLLAESLFHVSPTNRGPLSAYNLARLVKVHVDLDPRGRDSTQVGITGEMYVGDSTRRDSIAGLPERWRLLTATDPSTAVLHGLARALLYSRLEVQPGDSMSSGIDNAPVEGTTTDPRVAELLGNAPVGQAVDVCRSAAVPPGWLILYWYLNASQCQHLPDRRYTGEPNMMRIEREW
jgi:hypothetical protein